MAHDPARLLMRQARHSYTCDDILWDATFVPCVSRLPDGGIAVDFSSLHTVQQLDTLYNGRSLRDRSPNADSTARRRHSAFAATGSFAPFTLPRPLSAIVSTSPRTSDENN